MEVDAAHIRRAALGLVMAGLAMTTGLLFWAGVRHNDAATRLRQDGVAVEATVTGCRGLMGGSGSNLVGYTCTGSFSLAGRSYRAGLPGSAPHGVGDRVRVITTPEDPTLLVSAGDVASEHSSWSVFVVPSLLLAALMALAALALSGRSRSAGGYTSCWRTAAPS
ncbi:MAG TPA: DUF3592 domain-containing protein [Acidimicrobiales bacterium]|nr:DUF3592 domain-containing protein [Acidimicrobiales bacterium]